MPHCGYGVRLKWPDNTFPFGIRHRKRCSYGAAVSGLPEQSIERDSRPVLDARVCVHKYVAFLNLLLELGY